VNHRTPLGPSLHTVVVHVNASSKLSKKLSANLGQHSTETECLAKRLGMSFKDYRRNEFRYSEQSGLQTRIAMESVSSCARINRLIAFMELESATGGN